MPKSISFLFSGKMVSAQLDAAVKREELYGTSKRLVLDPSGRELQSGWLTVDGRLLTGDELSLLYLDSLGSFTGKMQYENDLGPVEPRPNSFQETRPLEPASTTDLTRFAVSAVYPLEITDLSPGIYRTEFNYTASPDPHPALVLIRQGQPSFLLAGEWLEFSPVGRTVQQILFDAEEEEEEDTGFGFDNL